MFPLLLAALPDSNIKDPDFPASVPDPVYLSDSQGVVVTDHSGKKIADPIAFYENEKALTLFGTPELSPQEDLDFYIAKYVNEYPEKRSYFAVLETKIIAAEKKHDDAFNQGAGEGIDYISMFKANMGLGIQAICLLGIPILLVLWVVLREKLPKADETFLGLAFAIVGMGIFSMGIELGLTKLGDQIGSKVPASYKNISLDKSQETKINGFNPAIVQKATNVDGKVEEFFVVNEEGTYKTIPYEKENLKDGTYSYLPTIGPLFGQEGGITGIIVILIFAFILGYGATLAEPALNALGVTVEDLTVGTFKKSLLMQAVALGVGFGIALGVAKIMFSIPLIWMCGPPYLLLLIITKFSTEEFVNIGWDSAGVTTGPITVPLVLAMGLGIGSQVGVVEGFGILSMASVCPILSVLTVGMVVTAKRNAAVQTNTDDSSTESAAN